MSASAAPFLLRDKLRSNDALLMRVTAIGPQEYAGVIEKVYSNQFEGSPRYRTGKIRFVGSPSSWGATVLESGERALVFLRYINHSKRYYQDHWHGHFTVGEGNDCMAVAHWDLLDERGGSWKPDYLRNATRHLDPEKPWKVTFPFALLEQHLNEELALLGERSA